MTRLKARHVTQAAKPQARVVLVALLVVAGWLVWQHCSGGT
jgi:hypothetical protein